MQKWRKSPPSLIDRFDKIIPSDSDIEKRKMFGYPCCFVQGNMMMGLHQEDLIMRLSEEDRMQIIKEHQAKPFEPMGRPMREYISIPDEVLSDDKLIKIWVHRSLKYLRTLQPKEKKIRQVKATESKKEKLASVSKKVTKTKSKKRI